MIKARPVIFPGDGGGEFHYLSLIEYLAQLRKQRIRNFDGSLRHERRIIENEFLGRGEQTTLLIMGQGFEFFRGDSILSADRRPDVNSKRTPNQGCYAQAREVLERSIDAAAREQRLLHLAIAPQNLWMMRRDLHRHDHPSQLAPGERIDYPGKKATQYAKLRYLCTLNARHSESSSVLSMNLADLGTQKSEFRPGLFV